MVANYIDLPLRQTCALTAPCNHMSPSFGIITFVPILHETLYTKNETVPNKGPVGTSTLVTVTGRGLLDNTLQVIETYGSMSAQAVASGIFDEPRFAGHFTVAWQNRSVNVSARSNAAMLQYRLQSGLDVKVKVVQVSSQYQGGRKWVVSFPTSSLPAGGFAEPLKITAAKMEPAATPSGTGALVVSRPMVRCRFGNVVVVPSYVSRDKVRCYTPARGSTGAPVQVALSYDEGLTYTFSETNPPYFYAPVIHAIHPHRNSLRGNVLVFVHGAGFRNAPGLKCRFGIKGFNEVDMPATFISEHTISCKSPAAKQLGPNFIPYVVGEDIYVDVEVSVNGYVFSDTSQYLARDPRDRSEYEHTRADIERRGRRPIYNQLAYYAVPTIHRVFPLSGPQRGGTPLKLFGVNFANHAGLRCLFDTGGVNISTWSLQRNLGYDVTHVKATWVNSGLVVCSTPPLRGDVRRLHAGRAAITIRVRLTNNFNKPGDGQPRRPEWATAVYPTQFGTSEQYSPQYGLGDYSMPFDYTYVPDVRGAAIFVDHTRINATAINRTAGEHSRNGDGSSSNSSTSMPIARLRSQLGGRMEITIVAQGLTPDLRKDGSFGEEKLRDSASERSADDISMVVLPTTETFRANMGGVSPDLVPNVTSPGTGFNDTLFEEMTPDIAPFYGGVALVWQTRHGVANATIMLRCLNPDGARRGLDTPVRVPEGRVDDTRPRIVALDDGFVVVWQALAPSGPVAGPCPSWQVLGQRFNADCTVEGNVFRVSSPSAIEPVPVPVQVAGGFVVAWQADQNNNAAAHCQNVDDVAARSTVYVQQYMWSGDPEQYDSEVGSPYWKAFGYESGYQRATRDGQRAQAVTGSYQGTTGTTLVYSFAACVVPGGFVVTWTRAQDLHVMWALFTIARTTDTGTDVFGTTVQVAASPDAAVILGSQVAAGPVPGGVILTYVRAKNVYLALCKITQGASSQAITCAETISVLSAGRAVEATMLSPNIVALRDGFVVTWTVLNRDDTTARPDLAQCPPTCQRRWIGDGHCDQECNVKACGLWDGGDCCEYTCRGNSSNVVGGSALLQGRKYTCGVWGYDCRQRKEDFSGMGIYAKRYMVSNNALSVLGLDRARVHLSENVDGHEFRVSTRVFGHQKNVHVAPSPGGGFVAVYESLAASIFDPYLNATVTAPHELQMQRFRDFPVRCQFGVTGVEAKYLNATAISCVVPAYHHPGTVEVQVTNNEVDFAPVGLVVDYYGRCPAGHYCSDQSLWNRSEVAAPCSKGHFCPSKDMFEPIACYPGTYQPIVRQTVCVRCPLGHQCPRYGMVVPDICPAGYVCDRAGILITTTLCPAGHFCTMGTSVSLGDCNKTLGPENEGVQEKSDPGCWTESPLPLENVSAVRGQTFVQADHNTTDFTKSMRRGWYIVLGETIHMVDYSGALTPNRLPITPAYKGETRGSIVAYKRYSNGSAVTANVVRPLLCPVRTFCGPGIRKQTTLACNPFTRGTYRESNGDHCVNANDHRLLQVRLQAGARLHVTTAPGGADIEWGELLDSGMDNFRLRLDNGVVLRNVSRGRLQLCSTGQCYLTPQPCEAGFYCEVGSQTPRGVTDKLAGGTSCQKTKYCPSDAILKVSTRRRRSRSLSHAASLFDPYPVYEFPTPYKKCNIENYLKMNLLHRNCSKTVYGDLQRRPQEMCEPEGYCIQENPVMAKRCVNAEEQDSKRFSCDCPMGHYCPDKSLEPLPCPIGFYNDLNSQATCLDCKKGFTCPATSMVVMQVCKPGSICDTARLTTEQKACTKGFYCLKKVRSEDNLCDLSDKFNVVCSYDTLTEWLKTTPFTRVTKRAAPLNESTMKGVAPKPAYDYGKEPDLLPKDIKIHSDLLELKLDINREKVGWVEIHGQYYDTERVGKSGEYRVGFRSSTTIGKWLWTQKLLEDKPLTCSAGQKCDIAPYTRTGSAKALIFNCTPSCDMRDRASPGDHIVVGNDVYTVAQRSENSILGNATVIPLTTVYLGDRRPVLNGVKPQVTKIECTDCLSLHESYKKTVQKEVWGKWTQTRPEGIELSLTLQLEILYRAGVPLPCPPGYFCPIGTERPDNKQAMLRTSFKPEALSTLNFAFPCVAGTYCKRGTDASGGTALCPPGTYCPAGMSAPLPAPPGTFAEGTGSKTVQSCFTGFYAASSTHSTCSKCPKGFTCPTVNQTVSLGERVMHVGRNDSVICPAGSVCDRTGLSNPSGRCPPGHYCLEGTYSSCTQFIGRHMLNPLIRGSSVAANGTSAVFSCRAYPHPNTTFAIVYTCTHASGRPCRVPDECDVREVVNRGEPLEMNGKTFTVARKEHTASKDVSFTGNQIPVEEAFEPRAGKHSPVRFLLSQIGIAGVLLRVPCSMCTFDNHCINKLSEGQFVSEELPLTSAVATVQERGTNSMGELVVTSRMNLTVNGSNANGMVVAKMTSFPLIDYVYWGSRLFLKQTPANFLVDSSGGSPSDVYPNLPEFVRHRTVEWLYMRKVKTGRRPEDFEESIQGFCNPAPFLGGKDVCGEKAMPAIAFERRNLTAAKIAGATHTEFLSLDFDPPIQLDYLHLNMASYSDVFFDPRKARSLTAAVLRIDVLLEGTDEPLELKPCIRADRVNPKSHPSLQERCSTEYDSTRLEFRGIRLFKVWCTKRRAGFVDHVFRSCFVPYTYYK